MEHPKWLEGSSEFDGIVLDQGNQRIIHTKFEIAFTKSKELLYIRDGQIIRSDQCKDTSKKPQVLTNLEQINSLKWVGTLGQNNQKIGRWTLEWKGEALKEIGGQYSDDGKKQGHWKETKNNYCDYAKVYEVGEYINDIRQGQWKFIYEDKEMQQQQISSGGGEYNQQGEKIGKWVDLSDSFKKDSQVTYIGEYQNGKKISRWGIFWTFYQNCKEIGGGSYDERCEGMKNGKWIEVDKFSVESEIIYQGEYKNDKKMGQWNIMFKNEQIGGGSYDMEDDGVKIGKWIELSDHFWDYQQVTYNGVYKNGKKVGRWDIWYRRSYQFKLMQNIQIDQGTSGGGSYDNEGNEFKIGNWIELSQGLRLYSEVTYNGEYKNNKKVGQWDILYRDRDSKKNQKIGGGIYDEGGNGMKIGKWIELSDGFERDAQITYNGEYENGKKVGQWDIYQIQQGTLFGVNYIRIGGGQYDGRGNGLKIGKWIDLTDEFMYGSEVIYNGEYKNGKRIGSWDICQITKGTWYGLNYNKIGGGLYEENEQSTKIGKWIELNDRYHIGLKITNNGEYRNGKKVGIWMEFDIQRNEKRKEINYDI